MIKSISILAIVGILGAGALAPRAANSALIVGAFNWPYPYYGAYYTPGEVVAIAAVCVFLFPLCLLDQEDQGFNPEHTAVVPKSYLRENGYDPEQIAEIQYDQQRVTNVLAASEQRLQFEPAETRDSLRVALETLVPDISETYVDFVADFAGISRTRE